MGAYNRKSGISKFYEVATGNLVLVVLYTQYMPCKIQFQIKFPRNTITDQIQILSKILKVYNFGMKIYTS